MDGIVYRWATFTGPSSGLKTWGPTKENPGDPDQGGGFGAAGSGIPAGMYEPRVLKFGSVPYGPDFSSGFSLSFPQQTIVIADNVEGPNFRFSDLLASGENIVKAPMGIHAAYVLNGAIANQWDSVGVLAAPPSTDDADKMQWSLQMQADDTPFNQEIIFPIRQQDFPNAPLQTLQHKIHTQRSHHTLTTTSQPVEGIAAPIIYGLHDSAGISNTGACPVIHVDNVNFYGLVSWGWVDVKRAYKNGVRQATSQYTVIHPIIGGQLYTVLAFAADQSANTWTVDVQGYESVGDGTGTPLNAPGECMLHAIRNVFCIGTPRPVRGLWNTSGGNVQAADFTLTGLAKRGGGWGYKVSKHFDAQIKAVDELNAWAGDNRVYPFLRPDGNLGVAYHDPSLGAITWNDFDSQHWFRGGTDKEFATLGMAYDSSPISKVIVSAQTLATGGSPLTPLTVYNPLSKSLGVENLSQPYGPAFG